MNFSSSSLTNFTMSLDLVFDPVAKKVNNEN